MLRPGLKGERLGALFLLGVVLFSPPLIGVFDKPILVAQIPLLYLFLYVVWIILIGLVALIIERTVDDEGEADAAAAYAEATSDTKPGP